MSDISPTSQPTKAPIAAPIAAPPGPPNIMPIAAPSPVPTPNAIPDISQLPVEKPSINLSAIHPTNAPIADPTNAPKGPPAMKPIAAPRPIPTGRPILLQSPSSIPLDILSIIHPTKAPIAAPTSPPTGPPAMKPIAAPRTVDIGKATVPTSVRPNCLARSLQNQPAMAPNNAPIFIPSGPPIMDPRAAPSRLPMPAPNSLSLPPRASIRLSTKSVAIPPTSGSPMPISDISKPLKASATSGISMLIPLLSFDWSIVNTSSKLIRFLPALAALFAALVTSSIDLPVSDSA